MDPSSTPIQNAQNKTQADQQVTQAHQSTDSNLPTISPPTPASATISVDKEGPAAAIAETSAADAEQIEMKPATPEFSATPEVEEFAERSPDQEKPDLTQEVQDAGVTHSGPGVIDVTGNTFGVSQMPAIPFSKAAEEEKKTPFNDSKHWFSAMIMYIWRKINPNIERKEE